MRLALFQDRPDGDWPSRRRRLEDLLADLAGNVDLLVCPELLTTGYGPVEALLAVDAVRAAAVDAELADLAQRARAALVYGTVEAVGDRRYNAARFIDRDGRRLARHRKIAVPPQAVERVFTPGDAVTVVDWEGVKVGLLVCFDVEFPEHVRAAARAGAQLVVVPTALWDRCPIVARKVVPVRAFENGIFLAYANYAGAHDGQTYLGESVIAGPDGTELARAGSDPTVVKAVLDLSAIAAARALLPFLAMAPRAR